MMNKEQLETIKKGYQWWLEAENQADKNEFAECITTEDVPALIAEVERLHEALKLIQNSDTWLIEPSPMMHTIEEAYHACVGIADKALGDSDE